MTGRNETRDWNPADGELLSEIEDCDTLGDSATDSKPSPVIVTDGGTKRSIGDGESSGTPSSITAYERASGAIGIRNHVVVLPSVICSRLVADRIADRVPAAVSTPHDHGCAQLGADNEQTRRALVGSATNPNVAGAVVVGLGCEHVQSEAVASELDSLGQPVHELSIQGVGGTEECVDRGVDFAHELVDQAERTERTSADLGDLTLGLVSSDARESTRELADPLLGELAESVIDAGGRVLVTGTERIVSHTDAIMDRAGDADVADALESLLETHRTKPARTTRVGATAGQLSLDAVTQAWPDRPIRDVVDYGDRARHDAGLAIVDAPSDFAEAATGLAAAGAQLIVHATGDGIPTGHPIVPVIKVSGDPDTIRALPDDIDIDATDADGDELRELVRRVANGRSTAADEHGLTDFAITRVGPSM